MKKVEYISYGFKKQQELSKRKLFKRPMAGLKKSDTLWNREIRIRCGVVDITEKVRKARLRWYEHVIRRDEGEPVRDIIE
jgi:hypothetical protein